MVFTVLPHSFTLGLCRGVKGNTDHCHSQRKDEWKQKGLAASGQGEANQAIGVFILIQAEFILAIQVKNVLKCIIMTMPLGNSTKISSISSFKRA